MAAVRTPFQPDHPGSVSGKLEADKPPLIAVTIHTQLPIKPKPKTKTKTRSDSNDREGDARQINNFFFKKKNKDLNCLGSVGEGWNSCVRSF